MTSRDDGEGGVLELRLATLGHGESAPDFAESCVMSHFSGSKMCKLSMKGRKAARRSSTKSSIHPANGFSFAELYDEQTA